MQKIVNKHFKKIEKQESKFLTPKENKFLKNEVEPVVEKIQGMIPKHLKNMLDTAFYKGFQLIFEKGNAVIEKTYDKEKLLFEHELNDYALNKKVNNKYMNKLDKQSTLSNIINTSFSAVEGSVLGLLGIGIPDIPVFISVIMKSIYEVALSYGYDYNTAEEKIYILTLIRGAITKGDEKIEINKQVELLAENIDNHLEITDDVDEHIKTTACALSEALLTAKFIQGIPVIGAIGGVVNFNIVQKVSQYSKIKYKKRYMLTKFKNDL